MTPLGDHNLARLAEQSLERRGEHPALLFEGCWHTSTELFERARRLAGGLVQAGVGSGDRVVVTMSNCPEVGIAYNAVWRAGAVVTPAMFLLAEPELRHVLADSEASAVITTSEFLDKVRSAAEGLPSVRLIACAGDDVTAGVTPLSVLESADPASIVARGDDDLAALLYTGGTTGRSKGVMLTHGNLHFTGAAAQTAAHVPGLNRALATLPLSHAYGILVTIAGMHSPERGFAVLLRWFEPTAFLELVAEHRLQLSAVVPSMLQLLLAQELESHDLSSLQILTSGGAPLPAEVVEAWSRRVPHVTI